MKNSRPERFQPRNAASIASSVNPASPLQSAATCVPVAASTRWKPLPCLAEVLGLKWSAVDLDRGFLSVVRTRTEYSGQQFEKDTKTAAGRRRVSLDPHTVSSLREHRRRQLEERLAWGEGWQDTGLAFTKEDGSPIRPAWVTAQLPTLANSAGIPRMTPQGLRHSWATLALKAGEHPKVVADRLGHASVQITLDRYSHVTEGLDREAADRVARLIDGT